jgi:hypothetical protein
MRVYTQVKKLRRITPFTEHTSIASLAKYDTFLGGYTEYVSEPATSNTRVLPVAVLIRDILDGAAVGVYGQVCGLTVCTILSRLGNIKCLIRGQSMTG